MNFPFSAIGETGSSAESSLMLRSTPLPLFAIVDEDGDEAVGALEYL